MSSTKILAAAAVIGLAGALLSLPALAGVSESSDTALSRQTLRPDMVAMEAGKAKAPKAKTKAAKKPAAKKAKGPSPAPAPAKSGGEYQ
jgi:hypothetical protein